jgi:hypothetical protein
MKEYTMEDLPMTMNSISWQLKRIAEALESINQRQRNQEISQMCKEESELFKNSKIASLARKNSQV